MKNALTYMTPYPWTPVRLREDSSFPAVLIGAPMPYSDNSGVGTCKLTVNTGCDPRFVKRRKFGVTMTSARANAIVIAAVPRLIRELQALVARCDGAEGVRADGSNIDTCGAHALLRELEEADLGNDR